MNIKNATTEKVMPIRTIYDILVGAANQKKQMSYNGPIIDDKGGGIRAEIMNLIDVWVHSFYVIEKIYIKDGPVFDKKKDETYAQIGKSYCYLNELNSVIASSVNSYVANKYGSLLNKYDMRVADVIKKHCLTNIANSDKNNELPCCGKIDINDEDVGGVSIKNAVMYFKFFNNLSASRIKYVFFREHPVRSLNYPILGLGKEFADVCYDLVSVLGNDNISLKQIDSYISKYCLLQELMFSFVYRQDNEFGVFLRFKYDCKKYYEISKKIVSSVESILEKDIEKKTINYKYFFVKVGHIIFNAYTEDRYNNNCDEESGELNKTEDNDTGIDNLLIQKRDSFIRFYNHFDAKKGELYLEPLTYQLYDILWKIHGVIDITDKSRDHKVYQGKVQCIKKSLVEFVRGYLSKGADIYKSGTMSYLLLYDMGSTLFGQFDFKEKKYHPGIYSIIFKEPDIAEVIKRLKKVNVIGINDFDKKKIINRKVIAEEKEFDVYLKNMQKKDEEEYKMEQLIVLLPFKVILQLLSDFSNMVNSDSLDDKDGAYMIGFYRVGVFLAHIANVFQDVGKRRDVWLFNTRPYVATHPIHKDEKWLGVKNIILVDDSIKTGFTYSLYESYVKRNAVDGRNGMFIKLLALFDYSYYKRLNVISQNNYFSLWKIRKNKNNDDDLICDWDYSNEKVNTGILNSIEYVEKDFSSVLDAIEDDDEEMDLSFFLTNTDLLLTVCMNFVSKIIDRRNKENKNKKIYLYSPTANGYVIMMMCIFLLRFKYGEDVGIVKRGIQKNDYNYLVAIDLSFVTGFTIMYNWSIDTGGKYIMREAIIEPGKDREGVDIAQVKKEFNMCAVVYCSCKNCEVQECTRCENFIHSLNPKFK